MTIAKVKIFYYNFTVLVVPNFKVLINARRRAIPPDAAQMQPPVIRHCWPHKSNSSGYAR